MVAITSWQQNKLTTFNLLIINCYFTKILHFITLGTLQTK